MRDVGKCAVWTALYLFLMAAAAPFETAVVSDRFPADRVSSVYYLLLAVCLAVRYYSRVAGSDRMRSAMLKLAGMVVAMIFLRGVKYTVIGNVVTAGRYVWYLYYVPMLYIPTLLFEISLLIYAKDEIQVKRYWKWIGIVCGLLSLFVVSNDLHGLVFRFQPGFVNWDGDYTYGPLYYIVNVWEYLFYFLAAAVLTVKCSISRIRYRVGVILVPFAIGLVMVLLLVTGNIPKLNGKNPFEIPETYCFMAAGMLECCMQLGLIPTNESYQDLMKHISVPVQITDTEGRAVYRSETAGEIKKEYLALPSQARVDEHIILNRLTIPGGYGFWQNDVTELDWLNDALEETGERLSEEAELKRLDNQLTEKRKNIEQRDAVYDSIAVHVHSQSKEISLLAEAALHTDDPAQRERCRNMIMLQSVYIKRYVNLILLSSDSKKLNTGELGLAVTEILRYLNRYGVPGEFVSRGERIIPADKALAVLEVFGALLSHHVKNANGIFASQTADSETFVFKLALENPAEGEPEGIAEKISAADGEISFDMEDNVGYYRFQFALGGDCS